MNCIHELVCKHRVEKDDNKCALGDVCKFISDPAQHIVQPVLAKKRSYKKRNQVAQKKAVYTPKKKSNNSGKAPADYLHLTKSDKDIQRALMILKLRRRRASLSENQAAALAMYDGIRVNKLAEHQRQQILNILNELKEQ